MIKNTPRPAIDRGTVLGAIPCEDRRRLVKVWHRALVAATTERAQSHAAWSDRSLYSVAHDHATTLAKVEFAADLEAGRIDLDEGAGFLVVTFPGGVGVRLNKLNSSRRPARNKTKRSGAAHGDTLTGFLFQDLGEEHALNSLTGVLFCGYVLDPKGQADPAIYLVATGEHAWEHRLDDEATGASGAIVAAAGSPRSTGVRGLKRREAASE